MTRFRLAAAAAALAALVPARAAAQDNVLNLYSARHYQTDEALYANFTKATGIKINRIEAGDEQLIERLKSEGANSPADVLLIVDASRLYNAQQLGLFQPVKSTVLESRLPGVDARTERQVVRLLEPRARDRLQQGGGQPGRRPDLRVAGRPEEQGADLHAQRVASVQPVAGRRDDRASRRGEDRGLGEGRGRQHRARAEGRRHRPDQGRGRRRMRDLRFNNSYYYVRLVRSTKPEDREIATKTARHLAEPVDVRHAHQHLGRGRAQERAAQGKRDQVPRVPRERRGAGATSPTATTSGRRSRASR